MKWRFGPKLKNNMADRNSMDNLDHGTQVTLADSIVGVAHDAAQLAAVRTRCSKLVNRKSLMSAGASAVPVLGFDVAVDMRLLQQVVEQINAAYGLSESQLHDLAPRQRIATYSTIVGLGSTLIGRAMTRDLIYKLLVRSGVKLVSRNATKLVPVVGSMISAAIGFTAFRAMAMRHIDDCERVVRQLQVTPLSSS